MPLEVGNYISDFDTTTPDGSVDPVYLLDDGQRLIKQFVKQSFPNIGSEVSASAGDLNRSIFLRSVDRETSATSGDLNRLTLMRSIESEISASSGDLNRITLLRDFTDDEISGLPFPAGTVMLFAQASAPTGWTGSTAGWGHMLRIVDSGSGGGTGGSMNPVSGLTVTQSHTLTTAEIPAHTHTVNACADVAELKDGTLLGNVANVSAESTGSTGGGGGHTHSISWAPLYLDVIAATKT